MQQTNALWFPSAGHCEIRAEPLPMPKSDEVQVQVYFSAISRGTETLVFHGRVPKSEDVRMRGPHMGGDFAFPVKYGYASVGRVEHGPATLKDKFVFCLHPHQDRFVVSQTMVTPIPDTVPPERAVLTANMETALNIVWDAKIQPGDTVAIFGAGVVGALTAFIASQIIGTEVILIDRDPSRHALASALGIAFATSEDLAGEFDILINASGAPEALAQAIQHADQEALIVEASWHGDRDAVLPLGGAFHARRLSIISSQVGSVPAFRRARWDFGRRLSKALDLLSDQRLDSLISGETAFSDLPDAYPSIIDSKDTLCHRIRY